MAQRERGGARLDLLEARVLLVRARRLLQVEHVTPFWEDALLSEHRHQRAGAAADERHDRLVVGVVDLWDGEPLLGVPGLRRLEEHADEEPLQLLVGKVDAELLD